MSAPDLTDTRQHAEAVAYGKLLATRQILDGLATRRALHALCENAEFLRGYDHAVAIVAGTRLGVDTSRPSADEGTR